MRALLLPLAGALLSPDGAAAHAARRAGRVARVRYRPLALRRGRAAPRRLDGRPLAVAWADAHDAGLGLANVHTEKVRVTHWERGEARAEIVAPVGAAARGRGARGQRGDPRRGIEAEVVEAASVDDLREARSRRRCAARWSSSIPSCAARGTAPGTARPCPAAAGRGAAAKLGAVALLLRSVGTDHDRFAAHRREAQGRARDPRRRPLGARRRDAPPRSSPREDGARAPVARRPRTLPDAESANVVGEVPGRERPGARSSSSGAHLDSWDLGTRRHRRRRRRGHRARRPRAWSPRLPQHPRRTVRVVLFANEEHGLRGREGVRARPRRRAGRPRRGHRGRLRRRRRLRGALAAGIPRQRDALRAHSRARSAPLGVDARTTGPRRRRRHAPAGARRPRPRSAPGRHALLRHPPHRQRHRATRSIPASSRRPPRPSPRRRGRRRRWTETSAGCRKRCASARAITW